MTARRVATCARAALQAVIDLMLEQFGGLVEQIDRHKPVGEPADHFVAAPPDRRQFAILVEHPERLDRRKIVALRTEKELRKQRRRGVLTLPRYFGIGLQAGGGPCRRERFAVASDLGINPRQHLQRLHLEPVAAPGYRKRFQLAQRFGLVDIVALLPQHDFEQPGFGRRRPIG